MTVFEKMLSQEKRDAFIKRKNESFNTDDEELALIEEYIMSEKCTKDIECLMKGDFFFEVPTLIKLRKNHSNKRRNIYRFQVRERILMKYMAFVMHDYDYLYSESLYSFRMGKRITEIFSTISRLNCTETDWVLKGDITGFGDHVNPKILCDQLAMLYEKDDPKLLEFFKKLLLRGEFYDKGKLTKGSTGALSGCALTNFFENVYLLDMDDLIREKATYYCRFADDIAIFMKTEEDIRELLSEINAIFEKRDLTFNESKTEIIPPGGSFELLGFKITGREYDIADSSLDKIEWKLRHRARKLVRMYRKGYITKEEAEQRMIDRVNNYFFKRDKERHEINWVDWAFKIITRCDSLRRIDSCAQSCIRYAGSGGKYGDIRYKVRYKDMQKKGYRTLVNAYYHKDKIER